MEGQTSQSSQEPVLEKWQEALRTLSPVLDKYYKIIDGVEKDLRARFVTEGSFVDASSYILWEIIVGLGPDAVKIWKDYNAHVNISRRFTTPAQKELQENHEKIRRRANRVFSRLRRDLYCDSQEKADHKDDNIRAATAAEAAIPAAGEQTQKKQKKGEQKKGEQKEGEQKEGEQKEGEQKEGEQKEGEQKEGEQKEGEQKEGEGRMDEGSDDDNDDDDGEPSTKKGQKTRRYGSNGNNDRIGVAGEGRIQDLFETPQSAFNFLKNSLMKKFPMDTTIYDPCMGNGKLLDYAKEMGYTKTVGRDLYIPDGDGKTFDLLKDPPPIIDGPVLQIINPPFNLKFDVLTRLFELGQPFFCLLPTDSMNLIHVSELFMNHGICIIPIRGTSRFLHNGKYKPIKYCSWFYWGPEVRPGKWYFTYEGVAVADEGDDSSQA